MRVRLTLPMRFATEKRATGVIRDNGLFGMGAMALEIPGDGGSRWRIVIDTERPDAVSQYLSRNNTPGVEWARSELQA